MFESIEEAISVWKEEFSFIEDAKVTGYDGGYPVVDFTIHEAYVRCNPPVMTSCGYPEVISRILKKIM